MVAPHLTVASVLWVGEFRRRNYNSDWVRRLRNMVERRLDVPHRFVCLTNIEIADIETIPLKQDWPGWWSKIELFDPDNDLGERVLYLDLDMLVTGDLRDIAFHPGEIAMMPPSHTFSKGRPQQRPDIVNRYQSSCMVWSPPAGREIFERFTPEMMKRFRGDQDWAGHIKPDCAVMPPDWFRKLKHCPKGPKEGVKLVICHPWKNDIAARKFPWVKTLWI